MRENGRLRLGLSLLAVLDWIALGGGSTPLGGAGVGQTRRRPVECARGAPPIADPLFIYRLM
jgi:hypothetical protein